MEERIVTGTKAFILALLMISLLPLLATPVAAQEKCCVDSAANTCDTVSNVDECTGVDLSYYEQSCQQVDACQTGCCCIDGDSQGSNTDTVRKVACSNEAVFEPASESANCRSVCSDIVAEKYDVTGFVTNQTGGTVAGVRIKASSGETTFTSPDGSYVLPLEPGERSLTATRTGCTDNTTTVNIDETGATADFRIHCTVQQPTCNDGIKNQGEEGVDCGGPCTACQEEDLPEACTAENAEDLVWMTAEQKGTQAIADLQWRLNSTCDSGDVEFHVLRGPESTSLSTVEITSQEFYEDHSVDFDETYYYQVTAIFPDNSEFSSDTTEVRIGHEQCQGMGDTRFCYGDSVRYCEEEEDAIVMKEQEACGDGQFCTEVGDDAMCIQQADCSQCNRLYGMHGDPDLKVEYTENGQVRNRSCKSYLVDQVNACYIDTSSTVVDPFKSCDISSCSEYKSQSACEDNPCNRKALNCTWQSENQELGLGRCISQDSDEAQITSCSEYATQAQCTGTNDVSVDISVSYNDAGERYEGTHEVIDESQDQEGLGLCDFSYDTCFKNADENEGTFWTDMSDCYGLSGDEREKCEEDFEPPTTTLHLSQNPVLKPGDRITYDVGDNAYSEPDETTTYYCFGNDCYPTNVSNSDDTGEKKIKVSLGLGSETVLRYYSEDKAHNLEEVQEVELDLDNERPQISVTYDRRTSTINVNGEIQVRTDLEVEMTVQDETPVACQWSLDKTTGSNVDSGTGYDSNSFSDTFVGLKNGAYDFSVNCVDQADNTASRTDTVSISADGRIANLTPLGKTLNYTDVTIEADTVKPGTCRFDNDTRTYTEMDNTFDQTGGTHHTAEVAVPGTGIYQYAVACKLEGNVIVEENDGHFVMFAVDQEPPTTSIDVRESIPPEPPEQLEEGETYKEVTVGFECTDSSSKLQTPTKDWSFGCDSGGQLFVCHNESGGECEPEAVEESWEETIDLEDTGTNRLKWYSSDNGTNVEEVNEDTFEIDHSGPQLDVSYQAQIRTTPDGVQSNLEVNLQSDEHATCTATLEDNGCNTATFEETSEMIGTDMQETYVDMPDGCYLFEATCTDIFGNEGFADKGIRLTATEGLITDMAPSDTFGPSEEVTMKVNTSLPGECRYSAQTDQFGEMSNSFDTNNGEEHFKTLSDPEPGVHSYNIACQLQDGSETITVDGNARYMIEFAVDAYAPEVNLIPEIEPGAEHNEDEGMIDCTDDHESLQTEDEEWDSGCDGVKFNLVEQGEDCTPEETGETKTHAFDMVGQGGHTLCYTAVDEAGNEAPIGEISFTLDTIAPSFSDLSVVAPPSLFDPAEDLTISSASTGYITGNVSQETVSICASNSISGETGCIQRCGGTPTQHCISDAGFRIEFPIAGEGEETLNDIILNATDDAGNVNSTTLKVVKDVSPPNEPTFTISEETSQGTGGTTVDLGICSDMTCFSQQAEQCSSSRLFRTDEANLQDGSGNVTYRTRQEIKGVQGDNCIFTIEYTEVDLNLTEQTGLTEQDISSLEQEMEGLNGTCAFADTSDLVNVLEGWQEGIVNVADLPSGSCQGDILSEGVPLG